MHNITVESVVEAYLPGILSRTGASMVCLSDNRSELKNSQMNTILKQLGIKHIFFKPCTGLKVIPVLKTSIIFLKEC